MIEYRRLATNASAILGGRLVAIGLGVLLATILVERLGAARYGIWSLLTLISGYSTLIDFGLSSAVERRVAVMTARGATRGVLATLGTTLALVAGAAALAQIALGVLMALPLGQMIGAELKAALTVLPACTCVSLASLAMGAVLAGQQRFGVQQLWRTIGLAVGTTAVIIAVRTGASALDRLLLLYTSGSLVTLALAWGSLRTSLRRSTGERAFDPKAFRDLLGYGGFVQGATMVPAVAEYVFRLVLAGRFGVEFAGIYDLGARAAIVPRSLAGALFSAMVPFAVQLEQQRGVGEVGRLLRTTARHVALFILPATAVLLAFAGPLITWWIGAADVSLVRPVRRCFEILLVAHACGAIAVPAAMVARALGRPQAEAVATAATFAAALVGAQVVSSWEVATALLWGLPAAGGFAVWLWLARTLDAGRLSLPDLMSGVAAGGVSFAAARLLAGWDQGSLLLRLAFASILAVLVAILVERIQAERWASIRPASRTGGPP